MIMADPDHGFDPPAGDLADVSRSGAREWERETATWEADAETLRLRRRSLTKVLWEAMQRGDQVTIAAFGHTFSGSLTAVRKDLAMLVNADTHIAVRLGSVDSAHLTPGRGGETGDRTFGSFRAYLGMLEVEGTVVRLVGRDVDVRGRIEVVAEDHVLVAAMDGRWAVAMPSIVAVIDD
jgi:hypothetical protein